MPRSKHSTIARSTRLQGVQSAVTYVTRNSGVTITESGIGYDGTTEITPTELGYLDGAAGVVVAAVAAGALVSFGESVYAGSSISITTGLTTCSQFVGVALGSAAPSVTSVEWVRDASNSGEVTAALVASALDDGSKNYAVGSGISISWIAIGS